MTCCFHSQADHILRHSMQEESIPFAPLRGFTTDVVARVESLRGIMSEAERQVEGLFESLLAESFE